MVEKRSGLVAGLSALVVGAGTLIAHQAGVFADDIARQAPKVVRQGDIPGNAADVLTDPTISNAVKQGVSTFRDMRNGTDEEVAVARAGCAVMNSFASSTADQTSFEARIRGQLPVEVSQGPQSFLVDRYVSRAANALYVANINGGAFRWYAEYCLFKP